MDADFDEVSKLSLTVKALDLETPRHPKNEERQHKVLQTNTLKHAIMTLSKSKSNTGLVFGQSTQRKRESGQSLYLNSTNKEFLRGLKEFTTPDID